MVQLSWDCESCSFNQVDATAWIFNSMVTSLPTNKPPLSSFRFQFNPKSLRLIIAVAEKPARFPPIIPASIKPVFFPRRVMVLVMPLIVKSPITSYSSVPNLLTVLLLKKMLGNCSASKKSGLFKLPSRFAFSVSIEETWMLGSTPFNSLVFSSNYTLAS